MKCTLIGTQEDEEKLLGMAARNNLFMSIKRFSNHRVFEHEAIRWVLCNAELYPSDYTLYFHTKGAGNASLRNTLWRLDMECNFLRKWKHFLKIMILSGKEVAGMWWGQDENDPELDGTTSMFFAGNFWMAANSYLLNLPQYDFLMNKFDDSRYLPERFIGMGNPEVLLIDQPDVLPVRGENGVQWQIIEKYANPRLRTKLELLLKIQKWINPLNGLGGFFKKRGNVQLASDHELQSHKIAMVVHAFYPDVLRRITGLLSSIDLPFDLIITCSKAISETIESTKPDLLHQFGKVEIMVTENKGRDILPFLKAGPSILKYDFVCKLHTKKSSYSDDLKGWGNFLFDSLIGNERMVRLHLGQFLRDKKLGIISPDWYWKYGGAKYSWGSNKNKAAELMGKMGFGIEVPKRINYPAGSMFWFRPQSLKPLFELQEIEKEFEEESAQIDGTSAHAIERLFHFVAEKEGYRVKILK